KSSFSLLLLLQSGFDNCPDFQKRVNTIKFPMMNTNLGLTKLRKNSFTYCPQSLKEIGNRVMNLESTIRKMNTSMNSDLKFIILGKAIPGSKMVRMLDNKIRCGGT
ncbi:hypothetical protein Leryth_011587, partial [Lithospermum erythrorhizon]